MAVVFMPFFSTLLAYLALPAHAEGVETGMELALITPLVYAAAGFVFGGLMAAGYNMFCWALIPRRIEHEVVFEERRVARAAIGDAA